jgi:ribosomal protein L37E
LQIAHKQITHPMPDNDTTDTKRHLSWYHCGRCGSLFQAKALDQGARRCSHCGFDPNPLPKDENKSAIPFAKSVKHVTNSQDKPLGPVRQTVRREKTNPLVFRLVIIWLMSLILLIIAARNRWRQEEADKPAPKVSETDALIEKENFALLEQSVDKCKATLVGFLISLLPEERSQFVWSPVNAMLRMMRHQDLNPLTEISPPTPNSSQWGVVRMGDEKAVEGVWMNQDGRCFEALFRKGQEGWLIDWEHFVRYNDMPFPIFLSDDGYAEGEFRLLARERLAEERKDLATISIVFYAPVFGRPAETGPPSPEFLIQRDSREGKLLEAAFAAVKNKNRPFNAKPLNLDPEGMIRVRVKIRRSGEMDARAFEIVELKACHWYSSDLPGFDVNQEAK